MVVGIEVAVAVGVAVGIVVVGGVGVAAVAAAAVAVGIAVRFVAAAAAAAVAQTHREWSSRSHSSSRSPHAPHHRANPPIHSWLVAKTEAGWDCSSPAAAFRTGTASASNASTARERPGQFRSPPH